MRNPEFTRPGDPDRFIRRTIAPLSYTSFAPEAAIDWREGYVGVRSVREEPVGSASSDGRFGLEP